MPKVLIVDDDRALVLALTTRLRAVGMEVVGSSDAHEAASLAMSERPDVILLDVHMPHYNGLEFHECLSYTERGRRIPVIYLSGSTNFSERQAAISQGAKAFLTKPYELQVVLAAIRSVLGDCNAAKAG